MKGKLIADQITHSVEGTFGTDPVIQTPKHFAVSFEDQILDGGTFNLSSVTEVSNGIHLHNFINGYSLPCRSMSVTGEPLGGSGNAAFGPNGSSDLTENQVEVSAYFSNGNAINRTMSVTTYGDLA